MPTSGLQPLSNIHIIRGFRFCGFANVPIPSPSVVTLEGSIPGTKLRFNVFLWRVLSCVCVCVCVTLQNCSGRETRHCCGNSQQSCQSYCRHQGMSVYTCQPVSGGHTAAVKPSQLPFSSSSSLPPPPPPPPPLLPLPLLALLICLPPSLHI